MRFVIGIQSDSGPMLITKDLVDELEKLLPAADVRGAFAILESKVKAATIGLGPGA